ncbi:coth protein-domain-containing protein [Hyaloraphidium curvatum]|nr:coth protein-domain-containing protein [Hyaloraphidium curvatum]
MERIRGFLQGSPGSEPSAVPWDAEGGHGTLASSDRQLWQFSRAAEHLLVHRTHSPLSAQIILDTHRLAMEGSIDGTSHQPVVVGRFRGPGEEVHADSYKYLPGAEVESAVAKLVDLYETRRNLLHPIELATWLFYELVTIHPFGNGNGRVCRLFLSWSLMRDGFPFPIAFSSGHSKARKHYVRAIFRARRLSGDRGDLNAMLLVSMDGALSNFVDHLEGTVDDVLSHLVVVVSPHPVFDSAKSRDGADAAMHKEMIAWRKEIPSLPSECAQCRALWSDPKKEMQRCSRCKMVSNPPTSAAAFPLDAVPALALSFSAGDWRAMQDNLDEHFAAADANLAKVLVGLTERSPPQDATLEAASRKAAEREARGLGPVPVPAAPGEAPGPGWFPVDVVCGGRSWKNVAVKYKGVSSMGPRVLGSLSLPFKLKFDGLEDRHPETKGQRFHGFREIGFANNFNDPSGMRDTLAYELFRAVGLPALHTAAYRVTLDVAGERPELGLYTAVEHAADVFPAAPFGAEGGNVYKPENAGATLGAGKRELIGNHWEKESNKEAGDWSDVERLYDSLHDPARKADPAKWRAGLEAVFDVDGMLRYLGLASTIADFDCFITFIPFDKNLTFATAHKGSTPLDRRSAPEAQPLIRYLMDDPVYWKRYVAMVAQAFEGPLAPDEVAGWIRKRAAILEPHAPEGFNAANR